MHSSKNISWYMYQQTENETVSMTRGYSAVSYMYIHGLCLFMGFRISFLIKFYVLLFIILFFVVVSLKDTFFGARLKMTIFRGMDIFVDIWGGGHL